jgi:methionyl-tRNA formyltransferase
LPSDITHECIERTPVAEKAAELTSDKNANIAYGAVLRVDADALGVLCKDGTLFNITSLQFENGRRMDIGECWHNLRVLLN